MASKNSGSSAKIPDRANRLNQKSIAKAASLRKREGTPTAPEFEGLSINRIKSSIATPSQMRMIGLEPADTSTAPFSDSKEEPMLPFTACVAQKLRPTSVMDATRNNFVAIAGYLRGSNGSKDKALWFETIVRRGPHVKQK